MESKNFDTNCSTKFNFRCPSWPFPLRENVIDPDNVIATFSLHLFHDPVWLHHGHVTPPSLDRLERVAQDARLSFQVPAFLSTLDFRFNQVVGDKVGSRKWKQKLSLGVLGYLHGEHSHSYGIWLETSIIVCKGTCDH